jgi:tRNA-specific 2-thiouridylase
MPNGGMTKEEVRAVADDLGLAVADKPESQEICFIPENDYAGFLKLRSPEVFRPGPVLDPRGQEVGRHEGIVHYTVGQRKGVGIPFGERRYVVSIDPERNAVVVGTEDEAKSGYAALESVHWIAGTVPNEALPLDVRIRNQHPGAAATVRARADGRAEVEFEEPQWAVAPGQSAVFYDGDEVLGGGIIERNRREGDERVPLEDK